MRNEGYIFIRGSTSITWDMVSGQTGGYGWSRRFVYYGMGGLFIDGYGWIGGMGGMGGLLVDGYGWTRERERCVHK